VSLVRDVTERAAAEQALALSRSRLDYATRLSGVGFWYCDLPFDELRRTTESKNTFSSSRPPGSQSMISMPEFTKRIVDLPGRDRRINLQSDAVRHRLPHS